MSGRLKLIEQQLIGIDSAAFQNLCDVYLTFKEQSFTSFNRTGSQLGKQKTVPGTPDTFFRLSDGTLGYVEYTTIADGIVRKIIDDIDKCLDSTKTGVQSNQINKIIICFNSRLKLAEETTIVQYASTKNIRVELIGIDWLAIEIYSKYLFLAKDILGIPLDTGQLIPLTNFVSEFSHKAGKLSTPLDNQFLNRKAELLTIKDILSANDILIISGFPGVGKTKIALEALNIFVSGNKDYKALAVSKKDVDIWEDLKICLQQNDKYVLLIDDANRQLLNFKQILGVFKEQGRGKVKLVITVRDYALADVMNECLEYDPYKIILPKFTDKEIIELISSEYFGIKNYVYQKRIVELADGNARLAVMGSRLAHEKQYEFLRGDISDLYDLYFQTFIRDYAIFSDKGLFKVLGIISFFYSINRSNKLFVEMVLECFEIDYYDFNEAISELEKRELVEVQHDYVKVSEQVMATYFFYRVFIKDELLSFRTLLFNFYPDWKSRFSDTIIPSNNAFGYDNVLNKINASLDEYLNSIYSTYDRVLEFFSVFWFYKREEMLNYFHARVFQMEEPVKPAYKVDREPRGKHFDKDRTLEFLSDLFRDDTECFLPAVELAFEYCRRKPDALSELVKIIGERLSFDDDDHQYNFPRQVKLFDFLLSNFKFSNPHVVAAFFSLADVFLSHHYQITKGGRKNIVSFYIYSLPFYSVIEDFRDKIWKALFENYHTYPNEVFAILKHYKPGHREAVQEILEFDLKGLIPFIDENVDPQSFEHIHFVHELIGWLDREKLSNREYRHLAEKFNSAQYGLFRKLDWNRHRNKSDYEFTDYHEFERLKEQDIRSSFVFNSEDEFILFNQLVSKTIQLDNNNLWMVNKSLDIIVEENFIQNNELGIQLLANLFDNYPVGLAPLGKSLRIIVNKSLEISLRILDMIKSWSHESQLFWKLSFFDCLPKEFINANFVSELLNTIVAIKQRCALMLDRFEMYQIVDDDIIIKIIEIINEKNEKENIGIELWYNCFEKYPAIYPDRFDLFAKAYIYQEKHHRDFDLFHEGLKILCQIRPKFLIEYISQFYSDNDRSYRRSTNHQLSFVWNLANHEELIDEAAELMIGKSSYFGIMEHPFIIFFNGIDENQKVLAKKYLMRYITKHYADAKRMNAVIDVIRHKLSDMYEEALLQYLSLNYNVEDFEKIYWRGNGGVYNGDIIIGDVHAKEWESILAMVDKVKNQAQIIPIRMYLKKQIEYELKSGEEERKFKFSSPDRY